MADVMKILYYDNRKVDPILWDASTPELEEWALGQLFKFLDDWGIYTNLDEHDQRLYDKAKEGDPIAVRNLLTWRKDWEYEGWSWLRLRMR